nr:replication protein A 70 kDa DNA-binding subunit B-like [Ipomoea batatas]
MEDFDDAVLNQQSLASLTNGEYLDFADPTYLCPHCGALFWLEERVNKSVGTKNPKFSLCCTHGKIQLPRPTTPPPQIFGLFFNQDDRSKHFLENIRSYNNMFCFTSMGGKIDRTINVGTSPSVFRLHGQNFHLMGSLLPQQGQRPKFAQLYIYDTQKEDSNRLNAVG